MKWVIAIMLMAVTAYAQEVNVDVYTKDFKPMIYQEDGDIQGIDYDILSAVGKEVNMKFNFIFTDNTQSILKSVKETPNSVGIAGITINSDRESDVDFSIPYVKTGLGIVVRNEKKTSYLKSVWIVAKKVSPSLGLLLAYILVVGMIFYITERGTDAISDEFLKGCQQAVWYSFVTITTVGYGDIVPQRWKSRLVAMPMALIGFCLVGNVLSDMNVAKEVIHESSKYCVNSHKDFGGMKVAVKKATATVASVNKHGAIPIECANLREAYGLLILGKVDAIVADKLALIDFHKSVNSKRTVMLTDEFEEQYYGIAIPDNSPMKEDIDKALLKMHESGRLKEIIDKWKGE